MGQKDPEGVETGSKNQLVTLHQNQPITHGAEMGKRFHRGHTDSKGATVKKYAAWGIPVDTFAELGTLYGTAQEALTAAQEKETRTAVTNAACKTAFDALVAAMRNIKKCYLYVPPLTEADLKSLDLNAPDTTPTKSSTPTTQVTIETYLVGRRQLGLRFIYVTGTVDDPANKDYRVYYKVIAQGETPPANPEELSKSFFTKRKKDVLDFEFSDSGKVAYFAVQVENEGKKGPWGALVFALIP